MQIPIALAKEAFQMVEKSSTIVIISHRSPDPDTIGSNFALREIFERHGKKVTSACIDPLTEDVFFLPNYQLTDQIDLEKTDLLLCVDSGSQNQAALTEKYPDLFSGQIPVINIDHHRSNNHYGTLNIVLPEAASTTAMIYELLKIWNEKITPGIATCLLYGLYFDTGSFMHSNTTDDVLQIAGELLKYGANLQAITQNLFHSHSVEKLKLWGKIFSEAQITDHQVVVGAVTQEDLKKAGAERQDISGAIDYLSMIKNTQFATMISEDEKGFVRGSLRTQKDNVNLSEIAELLNGGGHKKASGFQLEGKLKKVVRWEIKQSEDPS